jgi:hypothetical protein
MWDCRKCGLAILLGLLFFCDSLGATVNEAMRWELFSGYRNDRLHWHLQQPNEGGALTYSELYRDIEFWENGLTCKVIHRDLAFCAMGSYGAFGRGRGVERYADQSFTSLQPHFQFRSHGWAADTGGYIGYAVNLTADRTYRVIVIPLLGYSAHFERLHRKNLSPDSLSSSSAIGASSFTMRSMLTQPLHQTWYGFFVGGGLQIEPGGSLILQAGYTYHWMHTAFKSYFQSDVSLFNAGGALTQRTLTSTRPKSSSGGNLGQSGWLQLDYCFSPAWRLGLGGKIHYFATRVVDAHLHETTEIIAPLPSETRTTSFEKLKIRWTIISGWLQTSLAF